LSPEFYYQPSLKYLGWLSEVINSDDFHTLSSLFHALGQWGRSKNQAGDVRDLSLTSHFFVPEPARRPPAFAIVTPALSLHMETGYS